MVNDFFVHVNVALDRIMNEKSVTFTYPCQNQMLQTVADFLQRYSQILTLRVPLGPEQHDKQFVILSILNSL